MEFLRPVVVLRKFNNEVLWAVALTKKGKENHQYYFKFSLGDNEESFVIISQIRLVDAKRLKYKLGDMSEKDFTRLKAKIRHLLA